MLPAKYGIFKAIEIVLTGYEEATAKKIIMNRIKIVK